MTHHTGRHITLWLLLLGVFCLTLPSLTADLNSACQTLAAGEFQIRAMTVTAHYFYLLSSDGQLFVEDVAPFLDGIQQNPPIIELSKSTISLPTNWRHLSNQGYGVSDTVDYANPKVHFGFTANYPDDSSSDWLTLRLIKYECSESDCLHLNLCVYRAFKLNGRDPPLDMEVSAHCKSINSADKPVFWLNDHLSMYPILLKGDDADAGATMMITPDNEELQNKFLVNQEKWNKQIADTNLGTLKESAGEPQSGLLTVDVLFVANDDSTGHFLSVGSWKRWVPFGKPMPIYSKKLSEVIKLPFCPIEPPAETKVESDIAVPDLNKGAVKDSVKDAVKDPVKDAVKDAVKPKRTPTNLKILYFALAGIVVIVLAFAGYAVIQWQKKKKATKRSKKRDKGSPRTRFCSQIRSLLAKMSPCLAKKLNQREIVTSKVRQSVMLTSMAAASKRRKKGSKVGPTSRAAVSGVLTEMQKGLLAFKALMRQPKPKPKPFSMASTASTASTASKASKACTASLVSSLAETQSLDYQF